MAAVWHTGMRISTRPGFIQVAHGADLSCLVLPQFRGSWGHLLPGFAEHLNHLVVDHHKAVADVLTDVFRYNEPRMLVEGDGVCLESQILLKKMPWLRCIAKFANEPTYYRF